MKLRHLVLVLFCSVMVAVTMSGQARSAQEALEAARKTAVIDGDLTAAIKQYQAIVTRYEKTDRAGAAQALLRMAECYEKQGSAEAQRVYARVITEYGDQAGMVAEARARVIDRGTANTAEIAKRVWTLPGPSTWVHGNVSGNGRYLVITAPGGGLMLHDVVTGSDRVVVRPTPAEPDAFFGGTAFSRDSRKLAFEVASGPGFRQMGLRIIDLNEPGLPQSRLLLEADVQPCDWSPDGKWIAVRLRTVSIPAFRDPEVPWQLGVVSIEDGSMRVLKTIEARYRSRHSAAFSPDGRSIAFEVPQDVKGTKDIVVVSLDGRSEVRAVQSPGNDTLVGWSHDGRGVLYSSAGSSGAYSIWYQEVNAWRLEGPAQLVRADGQEWPLGLTQSGALFFGLDHSSRVSIKQAAFDADTGVFLTPIEDVSAAFVRENRRPRWSMDGRLLGYISLRAERGGDVFVTRDVAAGTPREVPLGVLFRNGNRDLWFWAPDGRSILTVAEDPKTAAGIGLYRVDLESGKASLIVARGLAAQEPLEWSADGHILTYTYGQGGTRVRMTRDLRTGEEHEVPRQMDRQSPDGSKLYLARRDAGVTTVVERHALSGQERELLQLHGDAAWHLTDSGRSLIALTADPTSGETVVVHVAIATGARKDLFRSRRGDGLAIRSVAPNGRSLIVRLQPRDGALGQFWWMPTDGRPARLLKELAGIEDVTWEFHPDSRHVALEVRYPRTTNDQIYVLENFLPGVRR